MHTTGYKLKMATFVYRTLNEFHSIPKIPTKARARKSISIPCCGLVPNSFVVDNRLRQCNGTVARNFCSVRWSMGARWALEPWHRMAKQDECTGYNRRWCKMKYTKNMKYDQKWLMYLTLINLNICCARESEPMSANNKYACTYT